MIIIFCLHLIKKKHACEAKNSTKLSFIVYVNRLLATVMINVLLVNFARIDWKMLVIPGLIGL